MANFTKTCYGAVEGMIMVGEAFTEAEGMIFTSSRYASGKTEWIKWKNMLNAVSKSDMRMSTLLNLVVYKIFEPKGLFEQGQAWEKAELVAAKEFITKQKVWDFNMKMPEVCNTTGKDATANATIKSSCSHIRQWLTARGVSDDAATFKNFMMVNASNVSLGDVNTDLVMFEKLEKAM